MSFVFEQFCVLCSVFVLWYSAVVVKTICIDLRSYFLMIFGGCKHTHERKLEFMKKRDKQEGELHKHKAT